MDSEGLRAIHETIKAFNTIIIAPHQRPDGDCMGTAFGMKDIIESTYPDKTVYVSGEETDYIKFLGRVDDVPDDAFHDALVIAVDTASEDRIAEKRYHTGKKLIKIDHHLNVSSYGDIEYVDTSRPAAALIVLDWFALFQEELTMTRVGAQALFTGTLTDTGRFKYPGVDGDTFRRVAMLFDLGLDTQAVYKHLDTKSEPLVRFKGYVLLNYEKTAHGVAYIKITESLVESHGVKVEEASSLVNELGVFEDCPVWVLLAEYEEKIVRARIRSKGPAINEVATQFDGGGHKMACGANLGTWERADALLETLDDLVKTYKNNQ